MIINICLCITIAISIYDAIPAKIKPVTPVVCVAGVKGCATSLVVPFFYDDVDRPYIILTIDGKKLAALIDTGASVTLIDSRLTGVTSSTHQRLRDFHGDIITTTLAFMKVCIRNVCDYEDVNIVPNLVDPAVLRGSFFNRFKTMTINYKDKTLTLEGWQ